MERLDGAVGPGCYPAEEKDGGGDAEDLSKEGFLGIGSTSTVLEVQVCAR